MGDDNDNGAGTHWATCSKCGSTSESEDEAPVGLNRKVCINKEVAVRHIKVSKRGKKEKSSDHLLRRSQLTWSRYRSS